MSMQDITLAEYDVVASVTEAAINTSLFIWLYAQPTSIELYYQATLGNDYVPVSQAEATIILTGTLVPTQNVVTLVSAAGSQTIQYAVTINDGNFQETSSGTNLSTSDAPWVFHFDLDLKTQTVTADQLPANLQAAVTGLDPSAFSFQQLYGDVSNATLTSVDNMQGLIIPSQVAYDLERVMQAYLKNLAQTGIGLGYAATANTADQSVTTLSPTALGFCVSQYTAPPGTTPPAGLDTLNYLIMTNGRPLPSLPSNGFGFNWVEDPAQSGTIAVRQELVSNAIGELLNPVFTVMSQDVDADARGHHDDGEIRIKQGTLDPFTVSSPQGGGPVLTYSYQSKDHDSHDLVDVSAHYAAACEVKCGYPATNVDWSSLLLVGEYTYDGSITNNKGIIISSKSTLPPTTYNWSAILQMQASADGVVFNLTNQNFNTPPTVASEHDKKFADIIAALEGRMQDYVKDITGINEAIQAAVNQQLAQKLTAATSITAFVFPLAQTFVFSEPQFTDSCDLVAAITYQQ